MIERASLTVLSPGLFTLVVDEGRPRTRSLGVAVGGAADRLAFHLGNLLVGNPPDAPALEITLAGPTLVSDAPLACVIYGAPFDVRPFPHGTTFTLPPGERLHIGGTPVGARAYLCIRGGLDAPEILGSRSALAPLKAGDVLACRPGRIAGRSLAPLVVGEGGRGGEVEARLLPGAQAALFPPEALAGRSYRVSPASNRMGLRLMGPPLPVPAVEMVSEPVCPGAVQVTRDGQCIVLGVDGQTIGGYPKAAQVVAADLDRLGQLRPGEGVRFRYVSLAEAEELYRRREALLRQLRARLETEGTAFA